ncbi:unnamed protein product [Linum tenue]|uniref:Uncharacterized protein n=1 Tax=Linum tenue TaxID=586396 RepID=A0AAV0KM37_9ROSI|nr:unnamed protein product [Linum tenue]
MTTLATPACLALSEVVVGARTSGRRCQEIKVGFPLRRSGTSPRRLRMLCRRGGGEPEATNDSASGSSKMERKEVDGGDDLGYLFKLGVGTFAGAAAIKYGSVVFPEITRPNLTQALLMISLPVVVASLLLFINQDPSDDN